MLMRTCENRSSGETTEQTPPIRLAMQGFADPEEKARLSNLFTHARHWQQPWEIVDNIAEAEFLLTAADNLDSANYPANFSNRQIISYTDSPSEHAAWHLRRPADAQMPSPLEFTLLFKQIARTCTPPSRSAETTSLQPAPPHSIRFDWREHLKVLIVGSVGSGKTTAINTLSEIPTISTEAQPSDQTQLYKQTTTIAMDFGVLTISGDARLHIYGAPGQRRFDFMSDILLKSSLGIIILISNELSDAFRELDYYLDTHSAYLSNNPAVIGVTHNDLNPRPSAQEYRQFMQERGYAWPVFKVDARKHADMKMLLENLLKLAIHPSE